MAEYKGSIEVISGLKQANNLTFPLVDASAVNLNLSSAGDDNDRLDAYLKNIAATKQYVDNSISLSGALLFKGIVNANEDLPSTYKIGWTYWVNTAGTYKGKVCEPGDLIFAVATNGTNDDWIVAQGNIDGAIVKSGNSSEDRVVVFTGEGNTVKDSGVRYSELAPIANTSLTGKTVLSGSLSRGRKDGTTVGSGSFAFGSGVEASGAYSHAEGDNTKATGMRSHSEGIRTVAQGVNSHAEGNTSQALGTNSHAEGNDTLAFNTNSHAQGNHTMTLSAEGNVSGRYNIPDGMRNAPEWAPNTDYVTGQPVQRYSRYYIAKADHISSETFDETNWYECGIPSSYIEIVGNGSSDTDRSNARALKDSGDEYLKGDLYVNCNADSTGGSKVATVAEIPDTSGKADRADTVLDTTLSRGRKSGSTFGAGSFAFGNDVEATNSYSHAEGSRTRATGAQSHSEGILTVAQGSNSHAEGNTTQATGTSSHAEGTHTLAFGSDSHAQGSYTITMSQQGNVSGKYNVPDGMAFAPEWRADTAWNAGFPVQHNSRYYIAKETHISSASFNVDADKWYECGNYSSYLETIGNGTSNTDRSNARILEQDGTERLKGDLYVGCNADSTGGNKVATTDYVNRWMYYTPVAISSLSFRDYSGSLAEVGSSYNKVYLSYTLNKADIVYAEINDTEITTPSTATGTIEFNSSVTGSTPNKTQKYTLVVTDEKPDETTNSASKAVTLTFVNNLYYGKGTNSTVNQTFVKSLSKVLSKTKTYTFTETAGTNEYIWFASPERLGSCTFNVGGFDGGFTLQDTVSVTNDSGYAENYYVYRSDNAGLGQTTVKVS